VNLKLKEFLRRMTTQPTDPQRILVWMGLNWCLLHLTLIPGPEPSPLRGGAPIWMDTLVVASMALSICLWIFFSGENNLSLAMRMAYTGATTQVSYMILFEGWSSNSVLYQAFSLLSINILAGFALTGITPVRLFEVTAPEFQGLSAAQRGWANIKAAFLAPELRITQASAIRGIIYWYAMLLVVLLLVLWPTRGQSMGLNDVVQGWVLWSNWRIVLSGALLGVCGVGWIKLRSENIPQELAQSVGLLLRVLVALSVFLILGQYWPQSLTRPELGAAVIILLVFPQAFGDLEDFLTRNFGLLAARSFRALPFVLLFLIGINVWIPVNELASISAAWVKAQSWR